MIRNANRDSIRTVLASIRSAQALTLACLLGFPAGRAHAQGRNSETNAGSSFGQPGITSFTPTAGPAGTSVTIRGTQFTGALLVRFDVVSAPFTVVSDSIIGTFVPAGGITGPIRVSLPTGTISSDSIFIVAPYIQTFDPTHAVVGSTVSITGVNFIRTTSVTFNGSPAPFVVQSASSIRATVPAGATNGVITVTNPGGSYASDEPFMVDTLPPPPPAITSFSPAAGAPGIEVILRGVGFTGASRVRFGSLSSATSTFSVLSDSVISAIVPVGARTGGIDVTTPRGTRGSSSSFIVSPEIASFTPQQAPIGAGIEIGGINFTATTAVLFNGVAASFSVVSDERIVAHVPASATDGPLTVTNPGGSDVTEESFQVGPTPPSGFNLSWDDCGTSGTQFKSFTCDSSFGSPFALVGSFRPPRVLNSFIGFTAQVDLRSSTSDLPDWWKHGASFCRDSTGLSVNIDFTNGPSTCTDFFKGRALNFPALRFGPFDYNVGFATPNRARLRIAGIVPDDSAGQIGPENEYYAFKVLIHRLKTAGAGSCAGCETPMCIVLNEIHLIQTPSANFDPYLYEPLDRSFVTWQGQPSGCPAATPVLAEAASIEADAGRVRVVWNTGGVDAARIDRREGQHEWRAVASVVPDGSHRIVYEDADIVAGSSYSYRLGIQDLAGEKIVGEISVTVGGVTSALELSGITHDPDGLRIALSLASKAPATIEIYDLGGRRRITSRLEGLGPGTHRAPVPGARRLESGVYFARLKQDGQHVSRRFLIVR